MKVYIVFSTLFALLVSCQNQDDRTLLKPTPIIQNGVEPQPNESLAAFLSYIGATSSELELLQTDEILKKYKVITIQYANNFYSKAARIRLIRTIISREDYQNEAIPYLLTELESFNQGVYPKEAYLLIKQAKTRKAIQLDDIYLIAQRYYNRAEVNFSEWKRVINLDTTSTDFSIDMNVNESIEKGIKSSASEKLLYADKLKEFFAYKD